MKKKFEIPDFDTFWEKTHGDLVNIASVEGVNFFQKNFDNQGFTDMVLIPWEPKVRPDGYKILLRTAYLKNSIQVFDKK